MTDFQFRNNMNDLSEKQVSPKMSTGDAKERMNFTLMPSLEHRALIKTTIALWNSVDIHLDDIAWIPEKWNAEDLVIGKVKELSSPDSLKKKILGFINPIGFEIFKWINHYQNILSGYEIPIVSRKFVVDVKKVRKSLSMLCWTSQGTIDRKKTAEELIRDDNLDIAVRYKLACIYCLKNDILKLWNKMPEYCRKFFYSEEDPVDVEQNELVVFWTYDIKGELTRMNDIFENTRQRCTPYEYAFLFAVKNYNKVAIEYFWQNLIFSSSQERVDCLERALELIFEDDINSFQEDFTEVYIYLLSQMNEKDQLNELGICTLTFLLDWPWQDIFMETANRVWPFISEYYFYCLLKDIFNKIRMAYDYHDGFMDYDYGKLFREIWQRIPITHKEYVKDAWSRNVHLLLNLFMINGVCDDYFRIIFASIPDREKLLFSEGGQSVCESLLFDDKMDMLEVFVEECTSSKDVIIKFKAKFENHMIHRFSMKKTPPAEQTDKLYKLNQLLLKNLGDDWERAVEGNTESAAKRFCSQKRVTKHL